MMRNAALVAGAILVLAIVLAAAIPPLLDWSSVKDQIAARVQAATGRPTAIDGKVSLRLLPSPALTADGLVIGNPAGMAGELARVERLRLSLAVLPLLSGTVQLRTLELDRPHVTLTRAADGRANWRFESDKAPQAADTPRRAARPEPPPAAVAETDDTLPIQSLTVRNGVIQVGDAMQVTALDADVTLGGRAGPFQARGRADLGGVAVALDGAVDRMLPGRASPASLTLRLPGEDAVAEFSGLLSRLSGGEALHGHLTAKAAEPARTLARLGVNAALPPGALALAGELTLSAEEVSVAELTLSVGDTRVTGAVSAALAATPQLDVRLHAAALAVDDWIAAPDAKALGHAAPAPPPPPSSAQPAGATPGFALPRRLFASANLTADAVTWRGQAIRQARVDAVLDGGEVLIRQASAKLPGGTDAAMDGTLAADGGRPVFDGTVRAKTANARAALFWLGGTQGDDRPHAVELTAPLHVAWPDVKISNFHAVVDGTPVRGTAAARLDDQPAVSLTAALGGLDMMVKGRMAGPGRVEDGAFKLTAPQGLAPLRAFGVTPPRALAKMQDLTAEGTASGTLDALAVDAKAESGGLAVTARGTLAALMAQPRADLAVAARAASLGQAIRALGGSHPQGGGPVALDARLTGDQRALDIGGLSLRLANTSVTGQGHVDLSGARPSVTADLSADSLNLDTLLGAQRTGVLLPGGPLLPPTLIPAPQAVQPVAAVGAGASPFSREPLELSALNAFDARLSLRAQTVSAGKWRLDTMAAQAAVQGGTATVERLTGKLLGGDLSASLKLSAAATPALSGQIVVSGADLGAAKLAGAGLAVTEGRMDAEARFSTTGRSSQDMAARLDGDGKLLVRNGILEGFDLPAVNQQMTNLRNIGSLLGLVQAGLSGGRTPFSQLAGTFRADNGIVTSRDLRLDAAGGGAGADALVNLPEWSTRTNIAFHLANAPQTPLGVRLEGPLENPRKVVDVNAIQQYMVSKGLGRALKGMGGDQTDQQQADQPREKNTGKNILKNLLKGLGGQ